MASIIGDVEVARGLDRLSMERTSGNNVRRKLKALNEEHFKDKSYLNLLFKLVHILQQESTRLLASTVKKQDSCAVCRGFARRL